MTARSAAVALMDALRSFRIAVPKCALALAKIRFLR
jgi:hypothetical protein